MNQMDGGHSLTGTLQIKMLGGALSMLKSKRKFYFVLDEERSKLTFYKSQKEFIAKEMPQGCIELSQTVVTTSDDNGKVFQLHTAQKAFELEAENEEAALIWMKCIQGHQQLTEDNVFGIVVEPPDDNKGLTRLGYSEFRWACSRSPGSLKRQSAVVRASTVPNKSDKAPTVAKQLRSYSLFANLRLPETSDETDDSEEAFDDALNNNCAADATGLSQSFPNSSTNSFHSRPFTSIGLSSPRGRIHSDQSLCCQFNHDLVEDDHWLKGWLRNNPSFVIDSNFVSGTATPKQNSTDSSSSQPKEQRSEAQTETEAALRQQLRSANTAIQIFKIQNDLQGSRIKQQELIITDLSEQLKHSKAGSEHYSAAEFEVKMLQNQNKFLNSEILRMSLSKKQDQQNNESVVELQKRMKELEKKLKQQNVEYVKLLQSCIKVPLHEGSGLAEVKLYGGDMHRKRVTILLNESSCLNPGLPNLDNLLKGTPHVDIYGFQHRFASEGLTLHYCCTQLSQHYATKDEIQLKQRWKLYLKTTNGIILNNKQSRQLIREGVPAAYRSTIWRRLVHQQVADLRAKHGQHYYKSLCSHECASMLATSQRKQIALDLMRTMPKNVHFRGASSKGIAYMHQVLSAFCAHNPRIGYCQGMNFIAGTALLFLSPEDSFWLMVALTEKYFVSSYFDALLVGAQADQEVLKELVDEKLPALGRHLARCDIELSSITLNWFLALFFDCVPFETQLRIWDCFLLEGPKVLFRFSLAILSICQEPLLERFEPMAILKILKAGAKYLYDSEGLFKMAFGGLRPFPNRKQLVQKQTSYCQVLSERLAQRQLQMKDFNEDFEEILRESTTIQPIYCALSLVRSFTNATIAIAYGRADASYIAVVDVEKSLLRQLNIKLEHRVITMVEHSEAPVVIASLVSSYICALSLANSSILWEIKLRDTALAMVFCGTNLFAALANGYLTMIENISNEPPSVLDSYNLPFGPSALSSLTAIGEQLWLTMGSYLVVLNARTLDTIHQLYVGGPFLYGSAPCFEKVICVKHSNSGIWLCKTSSPLIQLWDVDMMTCCLSYNISNDHFRSTNWEVDLVGHMCVTSLLPVDNLLWVGTADGYVIVYEIRAVRISAASPGMRRKPSRSSSRTSSRSRRNSGSSSESRKISTLSLISTDSSLGDLAALGEKLAESPKDLKLSTADDPNTPQEDPPTPKNKDSGYWESGTSLDDRRLSSERSKLNSADDIAGKSTAVCSNGVSSHRIPQRTISNETSSSSVFSGSAQQPNNIGPEEPRVPLREGKASCHKEAVRVQFASKSASPDKRKPPMLGLVGHNRTTPKPPLRATTSSSSSGGNSGTTTSSGEIPSDPNVGTNGVDASMAEGDKSPASRMNSSDAYDFDDLMVQYDDDSDNESPANEQLDKQSGLCGAQLMKETTDWTYSMSTESAGSLPNNDGASSVSSRNIAELLSDKKLLANVHIRRGELNAVSSGIVASLQATAALETSSSPGGKTSASDRVGNATSRLSTPASSAAASVISMSPVAALEHPQKYELSLQMMLKVSNKPVRCLVPSKLRNGSKIVVSCSGSFGEDESVLRWTKTPEQQLWTNNPVVEETLVSQLKATFIQRLRMPRSP